MVKEGAVTQDEMREAFTLFDSDKDGRLAPEDLGTVMRSLGENPTQADLKSIMSSEGIRGPFDFPKFAEVMKRHAKGGGFQNQLRDAFKVLDKDNSGSINVRELRHILTSVGEKLDPSEFDDWIKEIHVDDKGFISYDAFISRMVAK